MCSTTYTGIDGTSRRIESVTRTPLSESTHFSFKFRSTLSSSKSKVAGMAVSCTYVAERRVVAALEISHPHWRSASSFARCFLLVRTTNPIQCRQTLILLRARTHR